MINTVRNAIKDKKVLVLGYGREGKSSLKMIEAAGGYRKISVADRNDVITDFPVELITGKDYQKCLDEYDIVFKSPGIVLEKPLCELKCKITSQTELFFERYRNQIVGITGTKGKTTTSFMTKAILEKQGYKVGLIGTIATYIGNKKLEDSDRTTPESNKLQKIFYKMAKEECDVVVMEVSSQSLKLNRVAGCDFDIGVFTNFSEDHISPKEHPDMQDYFNSKLKLLKMCKVGFTNADDLMVAKVPKLLPECNITTYGIDNYCNLLAKDITITNSYVDFKVKLETRNERVKVCIPGRFSVYNALAAISIAKELNCSAENIKDALLEVRVPGRSELVNNSRDLTIMIDYAHSPESLENILSAVKSYTRGRVISVFGCGGDRDSGKRPIMGEISGRIADYTIITSDNPRTEDPQKIVDQIEEGIKKTKANYEVIVDRTQAIEAAIKMANKKDIIVLAGKGHEPYQEINGVKHPFDERIIVNEIIEKLDSKQSDKKKSKK